MNRLGRGLFAVAVGLALAAGCSLNPPADPTAPEAAGPTPTAATAPPAAPPEGRCYLLSFDDALAPGVPDLPPRRCSRRHTAETYHVGQLDLVSSGGHRLAVDDDGVRRQAARQCPSALADHVAGTRNDLRLSMLQPIWFTPTLEQADAGAEWFRCDVIVLAGDESLLRRTGTLAGALADGPGALGMCGTAAPDSDRFERVVCSRSHSWRAVSVVTFDGDSYPGREAARARGRGTCQDAGARAASDPLDFRWSYEWPTRNQWRSGMTYGRCWVPTTR